MSQEDLQRELELLRSRVAELEESEKKHRSLFESAGEAICVTQDGQIKYFNPAGANLTGYSVEELHAKPFATLTHPDDLAELVTIYLKRLRAEYVEPGHRFRIITSAGEIKWVESWSASITWEGRPAVLSMIRDVTKHVDTENLLLETRSTLEKRVKERTAELHDINERLMLEINERRRAEGQWRSSEERFRALIETMNEAFGIQDENGFITYVNNKQCEMLGYSREEQIGRRFSDFFDPESRQTFMDQFGKRKEGLSGSYEVTLLRKDGERVDAIISGAPVFDDEGNFKGSFGVGTDITIRKRAEQALRESEDRFRLAFHTSPDSVNINRLSDGLYVDVNEGFTELTGFTREEVIGKSSLDIDVWHDPEDRKKLVTELQEAGYAKNFEAKFRLKDGRVRTGLISVRIIVLGGEPHIISVTKDVDDWKKAEEGLRDSEATLRTLLQAAPVGIGQVSLDRTLGWTNDLLCNMLGYSREELAGQSARILYESDEEFLRVGREKHPDVLRSGTGSLETRFRRKDGSVFPVLLSSSSFIRGDLSQGMVFTATDITERKRAGEELRLYAQRLEALSRLDQMRDAPLDELTAFAMEEAVRLTGSTIGYVASANEDESLLTMHAWSKEATSLCSIVDKPREYQVADTGLWGEAVRQRRPIITNNYQASNALKKGTPEGHVTIVRHMSVPIVEDGKIVIVAGVGNKSVHYDENDVRQLTLLMEGMWRIVRKKRSEEALRESEAKYRHLVETMNDGVGVADAHGIVTYVNERFPAMIGYSHQEIIGRKMSDFLDKDWQTKFDRHFSRPRKRRRGIFETVVVSRRGKKIPVLFSTKPFFDEEGNFVGGLAVVTNITELKKTQNTLSASLKEKEVLLQEIHHRVKNNLQLILSLLRLQARKVEEPGALEVLSDSQNRVYSIALVHEKLYQSPNLSTIQIGPYVKALTNHAVRTYQGTHPRIDVLVQTEDVTFSIDTAVPLGMIVTELVSNVLRHAFPYEKGGDLRVSLHALDSDRYELCVADSGIGITSPEGMKAEKSMGLDLVRTFTEQLDGTLKIESNGGTRVCVTLRDTKRARPQLHA